MQEHNDEWRSYTIKTVDAGFVDEEEIEQARSEMSLKQFKQEFEASFETTESRIAWAFDREHNIKEMPEGLDTRTIFLGCDFNVSPIAGCIFVQDKETLYCIDEIQMWNSNTQELADEVKRRYSNSKIYAFPDPSGTARKTAANGLTDHTILQNAGFIVKCPTKHNPVRDGINAVNSKLCNSLGERTLFVDPRCRRLIESLEKQTYKPGTSQPDKESGYDHMSDALRYCVDFLFPVTREYDTTALPQRWGHSIEAGRTQARILR